MVSPARNWVELEASCKMFLIFLHSTTLTADWRQFASWSNNKHRAQCFCKAHTPLHHLLVPAVVQRCCKLRHACCVDRQWHSNLATTSPDFNSLLEKAAVREHWKILIPAQHLAPLPANGWLPGGLLPVVPEEAHPPPHPQSGQRKLQGIKVHELQGIGTNGRGRHIKSCNSRKPTLIVGATQITAHLGRLVMLHGRLVWSPGARPFLWRRREIPAGGRDPPRLLSPPSLALWIFSTANPCLTALFSPLWITSRSLLHNKRPRLPPLTTLSPSPFNVAFPNVACQFSNP
jgi:hypothetical protein